jgi:hypothetical protein
MYVILAFIQGGFPWQSRSRWRSGVEPGCSVCVRSRWRFLVPAVRADRRWRRGGRPLRQLGGEGLRDLFACWSVAHPSEDEQRERGSGVESAEQRSLRVRCHVVAPMNAHARLSAGATARANLGPMNALPARPPRDTGPIELRDFGPTGRRLGTAADCYDGSRHVASGGYSLQSPWDPHLYRADRSRMRLVATGQPFRQ